MCVIAALYHVRKYSTNHCVINFFLPNPIHNDYSTVRTPHAPQVKARNYNMTELAQHRLFWLVLLICSSLSSSLCADIVFITLWVQTTFILIVFRKQPAPIYSVVQKLFMYKFVVLRNNICFSGKGDSFDFCNGPLSSNVKQAVVVCIHWHSGVNTNVPVLHLCTIVNKDNC